MKRPAGRRTRPGLLVLPAVVTALCCLQCTPLRPFHTEPGMGVDEHATRFPVVQSNQGGPDFSLAKVEFDDQGELWNPNQLTFVVDEIKRASAGRPLLMIVYTHGWNNDAGPSVGNNLLEFKNTLAGLSNSFDDPKDGAEPRRLFGVFLGWRGGTVRGVPVLADFWNRMSAAHRVGAGAAVTECLFAVTQAARRANPRNRVVVIGHSFGGIVTENAVSKGLAAQVGASPGNGAPLDFGADLVILLNQAERSTYARQLVTTFKRRQVRYQRRGPDGSRVDMPLVVSLSSEGDLATRIAFPTGVGIGRLFGAGVVSGKLRPSGGARAYDDPGIEGSQGYALYHTPGHNRYLWSHETSLAGYPAGDRGPLLSEEIWAQNRYPLFDPADGSLTFRSQHGRLVVRPANGFNDTPYWVFRIDRKLVRNHSDFWIKDLMAIAVSMASMKDGLLLPDGRTLGPDRSARPRVMR